MGLGERSEGDGGGRLPEALIPDGLRATQPIRRVPLRVACAGPSDLPKGVMMRGLVALMVLALSSCGSEMTEHDGAPVTMDSAGVRIVEYPPSRHGESETELVEVLRIGEAVGAEELLFSSIAAGKILPDGSFVLADAGAQELVQFTSDGTFLMRQGGEGEGPGEYEFIRGMGDCSSDGFTVFDMGWSMSFYDKTGHFIEERVTLFEGGATPYHLACHPSGRLAVINWDLAALGQRGFHVATSRLRLLDVDGSEIVDLGVRIGSERFGLPTGSGPHPIGRTTRFGFVGSDLIVVDGTFFGFERWNREGTLVEVVRLDVAPPDADSLMAAYLEQTLARAPDDETRRRWSSQIEAMGLPPQASFFSRMHTSESRILMQEISFGERERWFEFQSDGTPLGSVTLPEGARLLDTRDHLVLVEDRDDLR